MAYKGSDVTTGERMSKSFVPSRRPWRLTCGLVVLSVLLSVPCSAAQSISRRLLEDTKLYFTAPLRWDGEDWLYFGGTLVAIGAAHEYDDNVRNHFATGSKATLDGKDPNSTRDALPTLAIVAGTWAFATLVNDRAGYEEGWSMLEAGGLTAMSTTLFKFAAGRKRPNETTRVDDWSRSGDSFPSMHVSAAFAIGTVLAESGGDDYRWVRRALGYGIATATAYARVHDNVHWLSDSVAGAALGIATAHFVMNRRDARSQPSSFMVAPTEGGGVMLTYTRTLH
jgi:hypothetical protein